MKKILGTLVLISLFLFSSISPSFAAWGAGTAPGFPLSAMGLAAEMRISSYKFAPNVYRVGETQTFQVYLMNRTILPVTTGANLIVKYVDYYNGMYVGDGTPTTPGLNENQLYEANANGVLDSLTFGNKVTIPGRSAGFAYTLPYTFTKPGYYRIEIAHDDARNVYSACCNRLVVAYVRVLPQVNVAR